MTEYRAYTVGPDGHFTGFDPLVCADDSEAIEKAARLVVKQEVELWCGARDQPQAKVEAASVSGITQIPNFQTVALMRRYFCCLQLTSGHGANRFG